MRHTPILEALRQERVGRQASARPPQARALVSPPPAAGRRARLGLPPNTALVCGLAVIPIVIAAGIVAEHVR